MFTHAHACAFQDGGSPPPLFCFAATCASSRAERSDGARVGDWLTAKLTETLTIASARVLFCRYSYFWSVEAPE